MSPVERVQRGVSGAREVAASVVVDGPALRRVRQWAGVGMEMIARRSRMSGHGFSASHLSRVERGGRAASPGLIAAYERALGVRVAEVLAQQGWGPGQLDDPLRRGSFLATVGALAVGAPGGVAVGQLLQRLGRPDPPRQVCAGDVAMLRRAAALVRSVDLRCGGGLAWQLGLALLGWAASLAQARVSDQLRPRLAAAFGNLAVVCGWAAFDAGAQQPARDLFTLALDAAVRAGDADLRAHVLAETAMQHHWLGHGQDALTLLRLASGDERLSAAARCLLHQATAAAHTTTGEPDLERCRHHLHQAQSLAELATTQATPAFLDDFHPAHTRARTGHILATIATHTGNTSDRAQAAQQLAHASEELTTAGRTRAAARCSIRLARLHLHPSPYHAAHLDPAAPATQAATWTTHALDLAADLRSTRVAHELSTLHQSITNAPHPLLDELAEHVRHTAERNHG